MEDFRLSVPLLLAALAASVPWVVATLAIRILRRPATPDPGPETMDLRPGERPAVANLLVNGFRVTPDAIPATLLDLAARRMIEIEQTAPGAYVCRIPRRVSRMGLNAYEQQVLHLLDSRAERGVVPTGALTTGPTDRAAKWWKRFRKEVVADAQSTGLSRDLWDGRTLFVLEALALLPTPLYAFAFANYAAGIGYAVGATALFGVLAKEERQRDTVAGRKAAAAWLGVKRYLETDQTFPMLPPTAVAVWERVLAYGAALGVAGGAVRALPMGAEDDRRAWSSHGERWRQVRIRYPRMFPVGWGLTPGKAIFAGLVSVGVALSFAFVASRIGWPSSTGTDPGAVFLRGIVLLQVAIGAIIGVGGVTALVRGLADLGPHQPVTGQVLRLRSRKRGENKQPIHYVALDDGTTDDIRAWPVSPEVYSSIAVEQYEDATALVSRHLRHVSSIEPATDR